MILQILNPFNISAEDKILKEITLPIISKNMVRLIIRIR